MSVWSRSHSDLARLAKSIQERNNQTRQGLTERNTRRWSQRGELLQNRFNSDSCIPTSLANEISLNNTFPCESDLCGDESRRRLNSFSSVDSAISPDFHQGPGSPNLKTLPSILSKSGKHGLSKSFHGTSKTAVPRSPERRVTFFLEKHFNDDSVSPANDDDADRDSLKVTFNRHCDQNGHDESDDVFDEDDIDNKIDGDLPEPPGFLLNGCGELDSVSALPEIVVTDASLSADGASHWNTLSVHIESFQERFGVSGVEKSVSDSTGTDVVPTKDGQFNETDIPQHGLANSINIEEKELDLVPTRDSCGVEVAIDKEEVNKASYGSFGPKELTNSLSLSSQTVNGHAAHSSLISTTTSPTSTGGCHNNSSQENQARCESRLENDATVSVFCNGMAGADKNEDNIPTKHFETDSVSSSNNSFISELDTTSSSEQSKRTAPSSNISFSLKGDRTSSPLNLSNELNLLLLTILTNHLNETVQNDKQSNGNKESVDEDSSGLRSQENNTVIEDGDAENNRPESMICVNGHNFDTTVVSPDCGDIAKTSLSVMSTIENNKVLSSELSKGYNKSESLVPSQNEDPFSQKNHSSTLVSGVCSQHKYDGLPKALGSQTDTELRTLSVSKDVEICTHLASKPKTESSTSIRLKNPSPPQIAIDLSKKDEDSAERIPLLNATETNQTHIFSLRNTSGKHPNLYLTNENLQNTLPVIEQLTLRNGQIDEDQSSPPCSASDAGSEIDENCSIQSLPKYAVPNLSSLISNSVQHAPITTSIMSNNALLPSAVCPNVSLTSTENSDLYLQSEQQISLPQVPSSDMSHVSSTTSPSSTMLANSVPSTTENTIFHLRSENQRSITSAMSNNTPLTTAHPHVTLHNGDGIPNCNEHSLLQLHQKQDISLLPVSDHVCDLPCTQTSVILSNCDNSFPAQSQHTICDTSSLHDLSSPTLTPSTSDIYSPRPSHIQSTSIPKASVPLQQRQPTLSSLPTYAVHSRTVTGVTPGSVNICLNDLVSPDPGSICNGSVVVISDHEPEPPLPTPITAQVMITTIASGAMTNNEITTPPKSVVHIVTTIPSFSPSLHKHKAIFPITPAIFTSSNSNDHKTFSFSSLTQNLPYNQHRPSPIHFYTAHVIPTTTLTTFTTNLRMSPYTSLSPNSTKLLETSMEPPSKFLSGNMLLPVTTIEGSHLEQIVPEKSNDCQEYDYFNISHLKSPSERSVPFSLPVSLSMSNGGLEISGIATQTIEVKDTATQSLPLQGTHSPMTIKEEAKEKSNRPYHRLLHTDASTQLSNADVSSQTEPRSAIFQNHNQAAVHANIQTEPFESQNEDVPRNHQSQGTYSGGLSPQQKGVHADYVFATPKQNATEPYNDPRHHSRDARGNEIYASELETPLATKEPRQATNTLVDKESHRNISMRRDLSIDTQSQTGADTLSQTGASTLLSEGTMTYDTDDSSLFSSCLPESCGDTPMKRHGFQSRVKRINDNVSRLLHYQSPAETNTEVFTDNDIESGTGNRDLVAKNMSVNKTGISTKPTPSKKKSHRSRLVQTPSPTSSQISAAESVLSEASSVALMDVLKTVRLLGSNNAEDRKTKRRFSRKDLKAILRKLQNSKDSLANDPAPELKSVKDDLHKLSLSLNKQLRKSKESLNQDLLDRSNLFQSPRKTQAHKAGSRPLTAHGTRSLDVSRTSNGSSAQAKSVSTSARGHSESPSVSSNMSLSQLVEAVSQRLSIDTINSSAQNAGIDTSNLMVKPVHNALKNGRVKPKWTTADLSNIERKIESAMKECPNQLEVNLRSLATLKAWMEDLAKNKSEDVPSVSNNTKEWNSDCSANPFEAMYKFMCEEQDGSFLSALDKTIDSRNNVSLPLEHISLQCHAGQSFEYNTDKVISTDKAHVNAEVSGPRTPVKVAAATDDPSKYFEPIHNPCTVFQPTSREATAVDCPREPNRQASQNCKPEVVQPEVKREEVKAKEGSAETRADDEEMETNGELGFQMDREFDKHLADMKPYVLKLQQRADRQKCAVWIKKLCEPVGPGTTSRKNRNLHAQLMLQMLKKGSLSSPFDQKPVDGPLQPLPAYVSIYLDDPLSAVLNQRDRLPDWVEGELGDTMASSGVAKALGNPAATSTWVSSLAEHRDRPHSSMGHTLDKDPSLSPIRNSEFARSRGYSADDISIDMKRSPSPLRAPPPAPTKHRPKPQLSSSPQGDREKRLLPDVKIREPAETQKYRNVTANDTDWSKPFSSSITSAYSLPKGTTYIDEPSYSKPADREVAMRTKMIEAKFHEEKLKLQQKHDAAVQKILDRKNTEIEDVKTQYRSKCKDLEDTISKLERKVQTLMKETEFIQHSKDKQISDMKKMTEEANETRRAEFEKRLHDIMAEFEQEKYDLQKQHTQNIQEILDDTNGRLQRMEAEYSQQTTSTTNVIKELESRVQQLMTEVDSTLSQRSAVEKEKNELHSQLDKLRAEHERLRDKYTQQERDFQAAVESHKHEIKTLKNKTEASLEYLKQEHSMAANKAADTISDLEDKVDQLKKSLKDTEDHRHRQIRELEQSHQQDKVHTENLHDKQIRNMKKEMEQLEADWSKKVSKLDQHIKEKEQEISRLREQKQQQILQSEQALEEFKVQVEKNQNKIYEEMKQQMEQVASDLTKSKQAREKQAKEFNRQLEEEKFRHQHEVAEMKMSLEGEKSQLMREIHVQKEFMLSEQERDMENLKDLHRSEIQALEARLRERQDKAEKTNLDNERLIRELREELVQANQLRKQQLVELGLLREEEKQKMHRDHEAELARLRAEHEQQRLQLQKTNSVEMETVLEKTNERLRTIEKEYADRGAKSAESIAELQSVVAQLRGDIKRSKESSDEKLAELKHQYEEEKEHLRKQYNQNLATMQREVENQRNRSHNAERNLNKVESDYEDRITQLKIEFEEKVRGFLPAELKQELEDTISSLKSQVSSLQQRAVVLQEELDLRSKGKQSSYSTPIKSSV